MRHSFSLGALLLVTLPAAAAELPDGYWSVEKTQPILDAALRVTLDPDLSHLTKAELRALDELLAAGRIMHTLFEGQRHKDAAAAHQGLDTLHSQRPSSTETQNLVDLYYLSKGPIATTLDNERLAFLPVDAEDPGKNVYPSGLTRAEIDAYLAAHPQEAKSILNERSVVRRAIADNIAVDLERLAVFPEIDALHLGLRQKLETLQPDPNNLYAIPYALAYAPQLRDARMHLNLAADATADESPDFEAYLRNRGRDWLTGDYESGDASWVSGSFNGLNVQIGSYETYDDALYGVKAFYSASVLARDEEKSRALATAISELQAIENSLPYDHHKRVRSQIPVGVYNVIADFGQSRGANTATILPNDANHARKYGRIILVRNNILTNPAIFANSKRRYDAVVDAAYRDHLTLNGGFNRTLWHEIGHYLGVSVTADGRSLDVALADLSDLFEEMKSDLVSLFAAPALKDAGYYDADAMRAHYADGIRRTLQIVQPRPEQPYQNMQLMQFNFFIEHGLIEPRGQSALLTINYDRYHEVVGELLREVLQLLYAGDYDIAKEFVSRWNYWDEKLHGNLAERMQEGAGYRSTLVRYRRLHDE
jgi:hypothetical protein